MHLAVPPYRALGHEIQMNGALRAVLGAGVVLYCPVSMSRVQAAPLSKPQMPAVSGQQIGKDCGISPKGSSMTFAKCCNHSIPCA